MKGIINRGYGRTTYDYKLEEDGAITIPSYAFPNIVSGAKYRIEIDGYSASTDYIAIRQQITGNYSIIKYNNGTNQNQYCYNNHWAAFFARVTGKTSIVKAIVDVAFIYSGNFYIQFMSNAHSINTATNEQMFSEAGGLIPIYSEKSTGLSFLNLLSGTRIRVIELS